MVMNGQADAEPLLVVEASPRSEVHHEHHYSQRSPWVRAAVLGACDGVVTVGALITGIASAQADQKQLLLSACAGMMSGALSMAVGEYVSVAQQSDMEHADIALERQAQEAGPESQAEEFEELVQIHINRGLPPDLARQEEASWRRRGLRLLQLLIGLAVQVYTEKDPVYFLSGALLPTIALLLPDNLRFWGVVLAVTLALAAFGAITARLGGSSITVAASRLVLGGWLAMLCTGGVGYLFQEVPAS